MSHTRHVEGATLREVLALLGKGEQLIICCPVREHADHLFAEFLRLLPGGKGSIILSPMIPARQGKKQPPAFLNPDDSPSPIHLSRRLAQRAKIAGRNGVALIDVFPDGRPWKLSRRPAELVQSISALLKQRGLRSIWLLPSEFPSLTSLKDSADYFLQILEHQTDVYAQFLGAKRQNDPGFFLRRRVKFSPDGIYLEPVPFPQEGPAQEGFRGILDAIPYPVVVFLAKKAVVSNVAFRKNFARGADIDSASPTLTEILGTKHISLVKELQSLVSGEGDQAQVFTCDLPLTTTDGRNLEFELSAVPVSYAGSAALLCTFTDITGRNKLARGIEQSEAWYRHIVENSSEAISVTHESRFVFVNRSFLALFGFASSGDVVGKEVSDIAVGKDRKILVDRSKRRGAPDGTATTYGFTGRTVDGSTVALEVLETWFVHGDQDLTLSLYRDVTARKDAEEELLQKTKTLEILRGVTMAANRHLEKALVIHESLKTCMKELRYEGGAAYMIERDNERFRMIAHEGLSELVVRTLEHQTATEGITGYVAKTMEPLVLSMTDYPSFLPHGSLFTGQGLQNVVYVPVTVRAAVGSIIMLASTKKKTTIAHDTLLFASLGANIGSALEHALLHEQLQESEERYRSLVEGSSDVFYRVAADGRFLFASPTIEGLLGHRADEFYRSAELWKTLMHAEDWPAYEAAARGGRDTQLEYRLLPRGKASYRWVRDIVRCTRNAEGEVQFISGTLHDVTDRKETEDVLVRSEHLKSSILDSIQEGIVVYDTDLRCVDWNRAMQHITGASRDAVIGRPASEIPPPALTKTVLPLLTQALAGTPAGSEDMPVATEEHQRETYLWARYSPLRDDHGTVSGVVGIITDVTSRRNLEREVRESEETLRNVIESMGDALIVSDLEGRIWDVNKDFTRITGYARSEALGVSFPYPWIHDEELPRFATWITLLREKNHLRDFDMSWKTKEGATVAISLNTSLLRNASGDPVAMVNIARDISDRKRLSSELEQKNRQMELLNRIISKANATMDFNEIFEAIAREVSTLTAFDEINVSLLTDDRRALAMYSGRTSQGDALPVGNISSLDGTPSQKAIVEKKAVVLDGTAGPVQGAFRSQISIPIYLNKVALGTFNLLSGRDHAYSGTELEFLRPIADHVGAIIDRVRLYAEVQQQVRQATLLYELGKALTGTLDLKTILKTVYSGVRKAVPVDRFAYGAFSTTSLKYAPLFEVFNGKKHFHAEGLKGKSIELTPDSTLWNLGTKGLSYVGDAIAPFSDAGSLIIVPARSKNEVIGFLSLVSLVPHTYTDHHLRLLESIATLTEIALDKAALYEEAIHKSAEIQRRNKELDDFTYVVSHDLKEPLISVEGYSKLLLEDYRGTIDKEGSEHLTSILQSSARMKRLINDLLTLSRVGRSKEHLSLVPCGEVLQEVINDLQFVLHEKHVSIEIPDGLPVVHYIRTHLHMVFVNLVSNAVKFNNKPDPRVTVGVTEDDQEYVFAVSDNGIGIDRRYFEKIFVIFQRLERSEEVPGTGAGLTIVKKIVEAHNGKVWVDSTLGEGTTIHFSIPK